MSVKDEEAYKRSFVDWKILDGCFGKGMSPTDLDGFIERRGHFLILETKKPHEKLSIGQRWAYEAFSRKGEAVIVVWGLPDYPKKGDFYSIRGLKFWRGKETEYERFSLKRFRKMVRGWYEWANKN